MEDRHLPRPTTTLLVDIRGAEIVDEEDSAPETSDIYLPKYTEYISHIAVDIGGSLAKVVYFTRAPQQQRTGRSRCTTDPNSVLNGLPSDTSSPSSSNLSSSTESLQLPSSLHLTSSTEGEEASGSGSGSGSTGTRTPRSSSSAQPNGILTPKLVRSTPLSAPSPNGTSSSKSGTSHRRASSITSVSSDDAADGGPSVSTLASKLGGISMHRRRSSSSSIPGGRLNFILFETSNIATDCIPFISQLISSSAKVNGVPLDRMRGAVKIMATGGGAHMFFDLLQERLGVEVRREEEMDCLITGLTFITEIPYEVFWYSDELVQKISHPEKGKRRETPGLVDGVDSDDEEPALPPSLPKPSADDDLPRPSPNPPQYSLCFDAHPNPQFPCLLVNIGSGVSMIKVSSYNSFERISGTSLGGGTLWGLLSLLTGAKSFDEMLDLSLRGDNAGVDMLVGDIYGQDYGKIGLKSSTIASSFGKVFRKGREKREFRPEDISKSLLYAVSNNIGQIAFLNAEKYGLDRIYFGGCFIRGHAATVSTLSYAIRFWSKGTKRAFFLRHEGYLGAIGAWLKNIGEEQQGDERSA